MKRIVALLLLSALLPETSSAQSGTTKCPIIASRSARGFQSLSSSQFVCFKSVSGARSRGYGRKVLFIGSGFKTVENVDLAGTGGAHTPAFRVTDNPALITYTYSGDGTFTLDLVNQATGATEERLVSTRGVVNSTIYVNTPGVFYLKINGSGFVENHPSPNWTVSVDTNVL